MRTKVLGLALGVIMVAAVVVPMSSASAAGVVTCRVTAPAATVATRMNTPVGGNVTCTHSGGLKVTYSLVPYRLDVSGPFNGKLAFDKANGNFLYTPGFYPPDAKTGKQDVLPEFTGPDSFTVVGTATDGTRGSITVPIQVVGGARSCDPKFVPGTVALFNNPAGSEAEQYAMLRYLIKMIDCTPAKNPDGTQATIRTSFYSLTYAPMGAALKAAAQRGVAVQVLTNSHADKYGAWQELARTLGANSFAANFATTCWQGCLTPRTPPVPGGPTAWFDADSTTLTSNSVVFTNRSIQGAAPIVKWRWNFGDGTKADGAGPFRHNYKKAGTYRTSLTVTDSAGRTHTIVGEKTLPDNLEPEYPSLHSKVYLFSTVGAGKNMRQWISAYSSGNPTYQQSRKGFNNLNVAVGDARLFQVFTNYFIDLVRASRGQLLTGNYFRSASTPGNPATRSPAMTVHFGPQTVGDINRDILNSIQCRYKVNGKWKRTDVKVSVFVLTRKGVASDLWTLAMKNGCNVEVVYTQMSQRVKGANGRWLTNGDGEPVGWGAADCLATPATRVVVTKAKAGKPAKRKRVVNSLNGCSRGSLKGRVPVTSTGQWLNRKSPISGGRLKVRMSCPVAPKYNSVTKNWAVLCIRNDIFTHHKTLLVNGAIRGKVQKYVMSGSANWSSPGLRASDEVITEIAQAGPLYDQYLANYEYLKKIVAKNSKKKKKKKSAAVFSLDISGGRPLDVRGMTDEQLAGQSG